MRKLGENVVLGIGIDIIEIARVERALERRRSLLERLFTPSEIAYCHPHTHIHTNKKRNPYTVPVKF